MSYTFTTEDGRYDVTVHGNGWAYEITCNETSDTIWLQDQDADVIKETTNDFENTAILLEYFEAFSDTCYQLAK